MAILPDTGSHTANTQDEQVFEGVLAPKIDSDGTSDNGTTETKTRQPSAAGTKELTPLQLNELEWRNSHIKVNRAKEILWKTLKPCVIALSSVIGLAIAGLGVYYGYQISQIAEPIGRVNSEIDHIKKYQDEEVKPGLKNLDSITTQLRMKKIIMQQ